MNYSSRNHSLVASIINGNKKNLSAPTHFFDIKLTVTQGPVKHVLCTTS